MEDIFWELNLYDPTLKSVWQKHSNAMHIDAALTSSQDCIMFKQQQLTSRVSVVWCRRNVFSLGRSPRCRPKGGVFLAYPHSSARNCISRILKVLDCNSPDKCMSPKSSVCKAGNGSRDTSARHSKNLKIPCITHYEIDKDSLGTFTLWWQNGTRYECLEGHVLDIQAMIIPVHYCTSSDSQVELNRVCTRYCRSNLVLNKHRSFRCLNWNLHDLLESFWRSKSGQKHCYVAVRLQQTHLKDTDYTD